MFSAPSGGARILARGGTSLGPVFQQKTTPLYKQKPMGLTPEEKLKMDARHPKGADWRRESPPTAATKALKAVIRKETRAAKKAPSALSAKPAPTIAKKALDTPKPKPSVDAEVEVD